MEDKKPLILISNDDGITAKGITELIKFLRPMGELVVMAPDAPRSGNACALTVSTPIHYKQVRREVGLIVYKCSGTPTDCVKLAFQDILDRKPDLVIGGINHGDNSAVNVHYSGTMGVAIEGCLKGVPSIGFSLCSHETDANFAPSEPYVRQIVQQVLTKGLPPLTCLNVNIPNVTDLKGVKVCEQTHGEWVSEWELITRANGSRHFWLTGNFENQDKENELNDHWAIDNGYVAITPVTVDVTARVFMDELQTWF